MNNTIIIKYTGETDVVVNQGYLSLTFSQEWFYSKDKHCCGIPVSMECTDTTGDAFFVISLHDSNNNINVCLSLDICWKRNCVVWVDSSFKDNIVKIDTSVTFCGQHFPQSIQVDLSEASLSETVDAEQNKAFEQSCLTSLDFCELWKSRKNSLCLDGIVLDTVLQNVLRPHGYLVYPDEYPGSDYDDFDWAFFIWCGLHIGSPSETLYFTQPEEAGDENVLNALKMSAVLSRHITPDGNRVLSDELCVFVTDKEHPNSGLNGISRVPYDYHMDDVVWDTLTNLFIHFEPDEIKEQQFIDIPVRYHDRRILLRLMLNPNWNL